MSKNLTKKTHWSIERKALAILSAIFVVVIVTAWLYSAKVRQTITASNDVVDVDTRALIEVEQLRNTIESQFSNSLTYFLLGSKNLFDDQKDDKQRLAQALTDFERQYSLPQIPEIIKRINTLEQQQEEIFDQALEFRAKQTESRIVGQYYRSKTNSILANINKALDEIVTLHNAELERTRAQAREAAADADVQIPRAMAWLTGILALLFLGMTLLVIRMLNERTRQLAERSRLYEEAKSAVQSRDEVVVAISQDLNEPLASIAQAAENLIGASGTTNVVDEAKLVKSSIVVIEDRIKDILDQTKADTGTMTLRLDQLGIDGILEDARLTLQPIAKQQDVRLEFNKVNPPVLAFLDRERVMRVLSNLIGNAIKFSPKNSKVIVKVRSDQKFVYISVKDSGPGIPEKQLAGIFDHFWQARKTADQGPGIGLAVVKTIVEAHGGVVSVESHVGHGSTFTFSLPRRRPIGAHVRRPSAPTVKHRVRPQIQADFQEGPSH